VEGTKVIVNGRTEGRVSSALGQIRKSATNVDLRGIAADLGTAVRVHAFLRRVPEVDVEIEKQFFPEGAAQFAPQEIRNDR
jgi:hypothetical protein